jgi:hypothetical protein
MIQNQSSRLLTLLLLIATGIPASSQETITVKAGTTIMQYFPPAERFLYAGFAPGKVLFKDGTYTVSRFNYNILYGEVQFIQRKDTLSISNPRDIKLVTIDRDTFYYDKGYLRILASQHGIKLAKMQFIKLVDFAKKEAYGTSSSTSASSSYSSVPSGGQYYTLVVDQDEILKKETDYFIYTAAHGFQSFRKKTVLQLFPEREAVIKAYLKDKPVDFEREEDLLRLTGYLASDGGK